MVNGAQPGVARPDDNPPSRFGVYEVEGSIGRGGTASLYAVRDTRDGSRWALKMLLPVGQDEAAFGRFRREFRALSRLSHPNIVSVRDWGLHGDRPWFTMELIEGDDLRALQPQWASLDPDDRFGRIQSVLVQVARALAYVHDRGLVHRDISPGNILLARDGTVRLTDFGLVTERLAELTHVGELMGTMACMAPEQIRGEKVDGRADLYALGTVLYQLLAGRRPFQAHTAQGWLDRHLNEVPRPPREIDPLVPQLLDHVCTRLLEKDPADRFASAFHLLHVLGDVEEAVEDRWPPRIVGRTWYKAWLRDNLEEISGGRKGSAVLLTGESGAGKTSLLDLADQWGRRRGLTVARGRCRAHDRPFGAWLPIYEALRGSDPPAILKTVFEDAPVQGRLERYPIIAAFRELVTSRSPCVILLDELEQADPATRELAEYLVRNCVDQADVPVLFVLSQQLHEDDRAPIQASIPSLERYAVGALQPSEVEEVVSSLLRTHPTAPLLAERVYEETGGSPMFVADMLRGLADEGVLRREDGRWSMELAPEEISRSNLPLPASLRASLVDRLAPLSGLARDVARTLALARRGLDLDALIEASGHDEASVIDAINQLVDDDIARERRIDDVDQVELSHGRFRDVLVDEMEPGTCAARHARLGQVLERRNRYALSPVVEDLAWHFEQAGLPPKACTFLRETARKHLGQSLYEEALYYLERALKMEPAARPYLLLAYADEWLSKLHLDRSRALFHLGQWEPALVAATDALSLADQVRDPDLRRRAATARGHVLRNLGRINEAEEALLLALREADQADEPIGRIEPLYHLGAVRWSRHDLPGAEDCWTEALTLARQEGDAIAQTRATQGLGILAFCRGQSGEARRLLEQVAATYEAEGMLDDLVVPRVNLIELYKLTGQLQRALRLAERMVAVAREVRHPHGIALGLLWRSRVLLVLGRSDEARRNVQEALRLAIELGTKEEQVLGLRTIVEILNATGMSRFALGRVDNLLDLLRDHDVEGVLPQVQAMRARCLAARGDAEGAERELASPPGTGQPHIVVRAELEHATAWREIGRPDQARRHAERVIEVATHAGFRLYEMAGWQELQRADPDRAEEAAHRAALLLRSISSGLESADATSLKERGAGAARR